MKQNSPAFSKVFLLLTVLFCVCLIAANLLETKQTSIGALSLTGGLIVFPISYIINDCLVEVWGFERARMVIWLGFAMNAGMFHPDYKPVGLLVVEGREQSGIVTGGSNDNFGMLPNGVFCTGGARPFQVIESRAFAQARPDCRLATQSGPMLVIDGNLHPRFLVDSDSRYIRNGVGVSPDGQTAWFAISDSPVTFHEFGRLFRDGLGVRDALYFDGSISRLYAPSVNRADFGRSLGPMIGLVDSAG